MPARIHLSGPLLLGDDDLRVHAGAPDDVGALPSPATPTSRSRSRSAGPTAFRRTRPGRWRRSASRCAATDTLPSFDARGALALGRRLVVRLDGRAAALAADVAGAAAADRPVDVRRCPSRSTTSASPTCRTSPPCDCSATQTRFDGRFRLYDMLRLDRCAGDGSPLPPLSGTSRRRRWKSPARNSKASRSRSKIPAIPREDIVR